MSRIGIVLATVVFLIRLVSAQESVHPLEADYVAKDFHFRSGEVLPELRLHYRTLGKPVRDGNGQVNNAVLIAHGTTGSGKGFLNPNFAGVLFGPGQLLDTNRYYIILPDAIGHGGSSKPSNGLHARFPHYDYDDMITADHLLLTEGLKVDHLRLFMGTSMGCMHAWEFAETYPDFLDATMPLACAPVPIAGRNRLFRKIIIDAIRSDPGYHDGDYSKEPGSMRTVAGLMLLIGRGPLDFYRENPTREKVDAALDRAEKNAITNLDANDTIYAFEASRNYDPSPKLDQIKAAVMFVNSADDPINPPEMPFAEEQIKKVKRGKFVLIPTSEQTRGHGTHSLPAVWKQYLEELLKETER
jgi:homoserine O-acetyltransferase/O-succinyltransferase